MSYDDTNNDSNRAVRKYVDLDLFFGRKKKSSSSSSIIIILIIMLCILYLSWDEGATQEVV